VLSVKDLAVWGLIGVLGLIIIMQAAGVWSQTPSVPLEDPGGTDSLVSKGTRLVVTCGIEFEGAPARLPDDKENMGIWTAEPLGDGCTGWYQQRPED
jgi:hypothetical protein